MRETIPREEDMKRRTTQVVIAALQLALLSGCAMAPIDLTVGSDRTVSGFVNPESCAYDPQGKVLYVGNFGSPKLDPSLKDGMGYISKVSLDGKILEQRALTGTAAAPMHKPKGIWIEDGKLYVTDIDSVWIFDLASKRGRKLALPGITFANDVAIWNEAVYVSDNRSDKLVKIEPTDFQSGTPRILEVFSGVGVNPNGIYPGRNGLIMGGFLAPDKPKGLYHLGADNKAHPISDPIGRIDGLYELPGDTVLATDWNTGALFTWTAKTGKKDLATGFKGPADFCVFPSEGGLTAVVPDLPQSHLRFIELKK
jgi:hypothetical protein